MKPDGASRPAVPHNGRWNDLGVRILSGLVLAGLGALAVAAGGWILLLTACVAFSLMAWELAALSDAPQLPALRLAIAALAGAGLILSQGQGFAVLTMAAAPLAMALSARAERVLLAGYMLAMLIAASGFVALDAQGAVVVVWLVLVVVVSDVLGYFAGRLIGGPLFWPSISPKKTWAGTVAGWAGAAVLGAIFALGQGHGWGLVLISPLVALAGQMGDIAESLIKRRAGVKDASRLIPGHGGVLDRFDALIGAVLAVRLLQVFLTLPLGGAQ